MHAFGGLLDQNKYFSDSHQIFSRPLLTPPSSSPAPTAAVTPSRRRCRRWAVIGWDLNHLVMWHQYSPLIGPGAGGWPLLQPDADLGEDFISGDEEAGVCQLSGIQGDKTHNMKYFIKTKLLPGAQLDPPAAMQGPVRRLRQLCGLRTAQERRHVILAIMFWYLLISTDIYRYLHINNLIFNIYQIFPFTSSPPAHRTAKCSLCCATKLFASGNFANKVHWSFIIV